MIQYITSAEYQELLGTEIPSNFNRLVIEASYYINQRTFGRINVNNIPEEVKYATAFIVELTSEEESVLDKIKGLKSQNIEGWSETYNDPEEVSKNYALKREEILIQYLWNLTDELGTPLLFTGAITIG